MAAQYAAPAGQGRGKFLEGRPTERVKRILHGGLTTFTLRVAICASPECFKNFDTSNSFIRTTP
jgi:hypothetical protein